MKLRSLHLRSAPGIAGERRLEDLEHPLVIVIGPNASGKSTVARAMREMLFGGEVSPGLDVTSEWALGPGDVRRATLVHGRVSWQGAAPGLDPGLAGAARLGLSSLARADGETDAAIARSIRQALDGGFDLGEARLVQVARVDGATRTARSSYDDAQRALERALDAADKVHRDEEQLDALGVRRRAAIEAHTRLERIRAARANLAARAETAQALAEIEAALGEIPESLERIPANAEAEASVRSERVARCAERARDGQRELEAAAARRRTLERGIEPPSTEEVEALRAEVERLENLSESLSRARQKAADAEAALSVAARAVQSDIGTPDASTSPDRAALEGLSLLVSEYAAARARLEAAPAVAAPARAPLTARQRAEIEDQRARLWQWLTAQPEPMPRRATGPAQRRGLVLSLHVVVAVAAVLVGGLVGGMAGVITGAVLVLVLGGWLWFSLAGVEEETIAQPAERVAVERAYRGLASATVHTWSPTEVRKALETTLEALDEDDKAQREAEDQKRAEAERQRLRDAADVEAARVSRRASELGFDAALVGLPLVVIAERVVALSEARVAAAGHRGAVSAIERDVADSRSCVVEGLRRWGIEPPESAPPSALKAEVIALSTWRTALESARREHEAAKVAAAAADDEHARAVSEQERYLDACGLTADDLPRLAELVRAAERRRELTARRRELRAVADRHEAFEFGTLPEDDALLAAAELEADEARSEMDDLSAQVAAIAQSVRSATDGTSIAEATMALDAARDRLQQHVEQDGLRAAKCALVAWVKEARVATATPALLERASDWFARFTRQRYGLRVDGDAFVARDHQTGASLRLGELSDGTRVQLLLSARLAWLEHAERGGPSVPVYLDEALSTADPERFAAIADAVVELAGSGRQVFYATSDPAEVAAWRAAAARAGVAPPREVHLDASRVPGDWSAARDLAPTPPPAPAVGEDVGAYLRRLEQPVPALHDAGDAWPLALLLHDDLAAAHRAACAGISTVGQLGSAAYVEPFRSDASTLHRVRSRAAALEAALESLRVGRGRPVTAEHVEASDAVSPTFRDRVLEQLDLHAQDSRRFVEAVGALTSFRTNKLEQLEDYLEQHGILDRRPRLGSAEIVARVTEACRAEIAAGTITPAEVARLVEVVTDVLGLGDAS